jgi:hypothetical protein
MAEFKNDYMTPEEREAYSRKLQEFAVESARQRWAEGKAGQLCEQLYRAYTAYKEYLERNYRASRDADCVETVSQQLYLRMRANLEKADLAERCAHVKPNGRHCGSPRMKEGQLCYAHARMAESRPKTLDLPSLEDPNGVQLAIMKLAQWLIDGEVDAKRAGTIAYMIQTAASNVGRVHFEEEEELAE